MQRKRSTEEEESTTAVQREMKEQNWNETGFTQVCLVLIAAFVRVFLLLPSVAVTWFCVVKSRRWEERLPLSLALLSFTASHRPSRVSSSFLWGRSCAWWGDGSTGDPWILVLCFLLRGLQDLQHTKNITKSAQVNGCQMWEYTCSSNTIQTENTYHIKATKCGENSVVSAVISGQQILLLGWSNVF